MLDTLLNPPRATAVDPALATALARAAGAIARLDQVLAAHPLRLALGLAQDWGARADRVNSDLFLDLGWTRGLDLTVSENRR